MTETGGLVSAVSAGALLGAIFFGGLWWTVRRGMASPWAALWFSASLLVRTGTVLAGFYLVMGHDWRRWLAGMAGFIIARLFVMRLTRVMAVPGEAVQQAAHAPQP